MKRGQHNEQFAYIYFAARPIFLTDSFHKTRTKTYIHEYNAGYILGDDILKILVTGGAGYIGSLLIPELLNLGYKVRVLDNLMYGQTSLLPFFIDGNFEFIKGDVRDYKTVKKAVDGADMIIHLAAIVGAPACRKDRKMARDINYGGTVNVDKARQKSQKLIYASTGSVYGALEEVCTENCSLNPLTTYSKTKLDAEQHALKSGNVIVYRFATAFGLSPRMRLDLMPNDFTFQVVKNGSLMVFEKDFRRTFIHVKDIVRSYIFGIKNFDNLKDEAYNVGSEELNYTKEDVALAIKKRQDYTLLFIDQGTDPDRRDYEVSYQKIRNKGFETRYSLEQGIEELIKGYQMLSLKNPFSNVEE